MKTLKIPKFWRMTVVDERCLPCAHYVQNLPYNEIKSNGGGKYRAL